MPPEKSKMDEIDLLSSVQPSDGWFAVLGIKHDDDVKQRLVATREEVDALAIEFVKEKVVVVEFNVLVDVIKFAYFVFLDNIFATSFAPSVNHWVA